MTDSSSDYNEPSSPRPNTFKGLPKHYTYLTEPERELFSTLTQIRDSDLSIHLYNAHSLKSRSILSQTLEGRLKLEKEFPAIPEEERTFRPPRVWTAWPLPSEVVPRVGEKPGGEDGDEGFTIKKQELPRPSRELEGVLMGVTLKLAKEKFLNRREISPMLINDDQEEEEEEGNWKRGSEDEEDENVEEEEEEGKEGEGGGKRLRGAMRPVVSVDDERSEDILRPSMRHVMGKLDDLLLAMHFARKTCRRYSQSAPNSNDEEDDDEDGIITSNTLASLDTEEPAIPSRLKLPRGRPRKFANLPVRSINPDSTPGLKNSNTQETPEPSTLKKTNRGRPRKAIPRLEGETEQEWEVRRARLMKKPLPSFAPPLSPKPTLSPKPARITSKSPSKKIKSSQTSQTPFTATGSQSPSKKPTKNLKRRASSSSAPFTAENGSSLFGQKGLQPRDWSEILGSAALVGFSPSVIKRATQRCADLFGEGMDMRILREVPFSERDEGVIRRYLTQSVPELDDLSSSSSSDSDENINSSSSEEAEVIDLENQDRETGKKKKTQHRPTRKELLPLLSYTPICYCPVKGCKGKIRGFKSKVGLKRHLRLRHGVGKEEMGEWVLGSDEDFEGGVRVDGFLRGVRGGKTGGERGGRGKVREGGGESAGGESGGSVESEDEEGSGDEEVQVGPAILDEGELSSGEEQDGGVNIPDAEGETSDESEL